MKVIREILGRIFALWALIVFGGSLLLIFIPTWIIGFQQEPKRTQSMHKLFIPWMKFFFVLSGIKRRYVGTENFKKGATYIVICNHNSFMDVPLASPGIPGANKTIAKAEMAKIPFFGTIYKSGSILVDRKSEESRRASFGKMKEVLHMGLHMCIYPEGTRNKSGDTLQRFHDGAFKLATETGIDIIPAVIFNTREVLPLKPLFLWPRPIEMHFLPAISCAGKTTQQLKQEAFDIIGNYYRARNQNIKAGLSTR